MRHKRVVVIGTGGAGLTAAIEASLTAAAVADAAHRRKASLGTHYIEQCLLPAS